MTDFCSTTATALVAGIKAGDFACAEVMAASIARIEAVDPLVNAMVTRDFDRAMASAKAVDAKRLNNEDIGSLAGLPIGIKDLEATKGITTTFGSLPHKDYVPDQDDVSVANVKAKGGIIIGKTNTPEYGTGGNTWNDVFGVTANPFDTDKTPAGSSGGSAAALATGMVPLATGSDFGGSLRTPASFCGVVGFRPSPGLVPDENKAVGLAPFAVLGPMARVVADAVLLCDAQSSFDARDPFSKAGQGAMAPSMQAADLSQMTAAISADLGVAPVAKAIRQLFDQRMGYLTSSFAEAQKRDPVFDHVHDCFEVLRGVSYVAGCKDIVDKHRDVVSPLMIDNVDRALAYSLADVADASHTQSVLAKAWLALFDEVDVVICPAASVAPYPHKDKFIAEIDGVKMPTYMTWLALSYAPTMVMACSLVVPCGVDGDGLPFGIQLLGPPGGDRKLLEIGLAIEAVLAAEPETMRPQPNINRLISTGQY